MMRVTAIFVPQLRTMPPVRAMEPNWLFPGGPSGLVAVRWHRSVPQEISVCGLSRLISNSDREGYTQGKSRHAGVRATPNMVRSAPISSLSAACGSDSSPKDCNRSNEIPIRASKCSETSAQATKKSQTQ